MPELNETVAARCRYTGSQAIVVRLVVAVVAGFVVLPDGTIAARGVSAGIGASVRLVVVAVVAVFERLHLAVSTSDRRAGRRRGRRHALADAHLDLHCGDQVGPALKDRVVGAAVQLPADFVLAVSQYWRAHTRRLVAALIRLADGALDPNAAFAQEAELLRGSVAAEGAVVRARVAQAIFRQRRRAAALRHAGLPTVLA